MKKGIGNRTSSCFFKRLLAAAVVCVFTVQTHVMPVSFAAPPLPLEANLNLLFKDFGSHQLPEDADSKYDARFFKSFPEPELLRAAFERYFEAGELTGGTAAALFNKEESLYHGIERWELYEEGIGYFLQSLQSEESMLEKLALRTAELEQKKKETYSKELLEADAALRQFEENKISFIDVLKKLSDFSRPPEGTELDIILREIQDEGASLNLETEIRRMAETVREAVRGSEDLMPFNQQFQAFQTSRLTPRAFAYFLKNMAAKHQVEITLSKPLRALIENQKRMREIKGTAVFRNFETYAGQVMESLFQNDAQRSLHAQSEWLQVLRRLAQLELAQSDWEKLKAFRARNAKVEEGYVLAPMPGAELMSGFEPNLRFYETAEKRDDALYENTMALMKENRTNAAIIVAGGFHTEGLTRLLKSKGVSYLLLAPQMKEIPEQSGYRDHMSGRVSWMDYFEIENGKVDLHRAFMRGARDRLLAAGAGMSGNLVKQWRDQIIRDLADEGRITEAANYTRLLDELAEPQTKNAGLETLRAEWEAKVDRFSEGLANLRSGGGLTENNVLNLIQSLTSAEAPLANALALRGLIDAARLPALVRSDLRGAAQMIPRASESVLTVNEIRETLESPLCRGRSVSIKTLRDGQAEQSREGYKIYAVREKAGSTELETDSGTLVYGPASPIVGFEIQPMTYREIEARIEAGQTVAIHWEKRYMGGKAPGEPQTTTLTVNKIERVDKYNVLHIEGTDAAGIADRWTFDMKRAPVFQITPAPVPVDSLTEKINRARRGRAPLIAVEFDAETGLSKTKLGEVVSVDVEEAGLRFKYSGEREDVFYDREKNPLVGLYSVMNQGDIESQIAQAPEGLVTFTVYRDGKVYKTPPKKVYSASRADDYQYVRIQYDDGDDNFFAGDVELWGTNVYSSEPLESYILEVGPVLQAGARAAQNKKEEMLRYVRALAKSLRTEIGQSDNLFEDGSRPDLFLNGLLRTIDAIETALLQPDELTLEELEKYSDELAKGRFMLEIKNEDSEQEKSTVQSQALYESFPARLDAAEERLSELEGRVQLFPGFIPPSSVRETLQELRLKYERLANRNTEESPVWIIAPRDVELFDRQLRFPERLMKADETWSAAPAAEFSQAARDYYQVLEVDPAATAEEIKKSRDRLVRENHPDSNPEDKDAAKRFKEIQEAYAVLGNAEKRQRYDRFRARSDLREGEGEAEPLAPGLPYAIAVDMLQELGVSSWYEARDIRGSEILYALHAEKVEATEGNKTLEKILNRAAGDWMRTAARANSISNIKKRQARLESVAAAVEAEAGVIVSIAPLAREMNAEDVEQRWGDVFGPKARDFKETEPAESVGFFPDSVRSTVFSADGRYIAAPRTDNTVRVWDAETGDEVRVLEVPGQELNAVALNADGSEIVTASSNFPGYTVRVWNRETGEQISAFDRPNNVTALAVSPDGRYVTGGALNGNIWVWDLREQEQIAVTDGHGADIRVLSFSPDGRYIASGSGDRNVALWDAKTAEFRHLLRGQTDWVSLVAFSPDGTYVAGGGEMDDIVRIWNVETGAEVRRFLGHTGMVTGFAFSRDGRYLAVSNNLGTVRLWNVETAERIQVFKNSPEWISSLQFSPDGRRLLSGGVSQDVVRFDAVDQYVYNYRMEQSYRSDLREGEGEAESLAPGEVYAVLVDMLSELGVSSWYESGDTRGGEILLALHADKVEATEGIRALKEIFEQAASAWMQEGARANAIADYTERQLHLQAIAAAVEAEAGAAVNIISLAASLSAEDVRERWGRTFGPKAAYEEDGVERIFEGHGADVFSAVSSPDIRYVLSGSQDGTARLWNVETGKQAHVLQGHRGWISAIAYSPDGRYVLTGSNDTTVRLWNTETGEQVHVFEGHDWWVSSVAFSPDSRYALSASTDGTMRVWNIGTGVQEHVFEDAPVPVQTAVFSPDGRHVLNQADNGILSLWSLETVPLHRFLEGHLANIYSFAFSPDGHYIVSGSEDRTVRLWNAETDEQVHVFEGHTMAVFAVAFSPDGRYAASGSEDETIRIWDVETGEQIHVLEGFEDPVTSIAFSPDGRYVLGGSEADTVRLWDAETGEQVHVFLNEEDPMYPLSVSFSPDGRYAIAASQEGEVYLWDAAQVVYDYRMHGPEQRSDLRAEKGEPEKIAPGMAYAVIMERLWKEQDVLSWFESEDRRGMEMYKALHAEKVKATEGIRELEKILNEAAEAWASLKLDQKRVAAAMEAETGTILNLIPQAQDLTAEEVRAKWGNFFGPRPSDFEESEADEGLYREFETAAGAASLTAFSADGRSIVTADSDGTLHLRDVETGNEIPDFEAYEGLVQFVALSPDGRYILSGSGVGNMILWDIETGEQVRVFEGHESLIRFVAFSPDGRYIISGSHDGRMRLWDVETGEQVRIFEGHEEQVRSVAFSPDGRYILSGSYDGTARLWDVNTGEQVRVFEGHEDWIRSVAFSPDGRYILSGSYDRTMRLWDVNTGEQVRVFEGHEDRIHSIAFSPDGRYIISGSYDGVVLLWDVETGERLRVFEEPVSEPHVRWIRRVAFSPNGRHALSESSDGTVRLWDAAGILYDWRMYGETQRSDMRAPVDAEQAIDHIIALFEQDPARKKLPTQMQLAEALDVSQSTISRSFAGLVEGLRRRIAEKGFDENLRARIDAVIQARGERQRFDPGKAADHVIALFSQDVSRDHFPTNAELAGALGGHPSNYVLRENDLMAALEEKMAKESFDTVLKERILRAMALRDNFNAEAAEYIVTLFAENPDLSRLPRQPELAAELGASQPKISKRYSAILDAVKERIAAKDIDAVLKSRIELAVQQWESSYRSDLREGEDEAAPIAPGFAYAVTMEPLAQSEVLSWFAAEDAQGLAMYKALHADTVMRSEGGLELQEILNEAAAAWASPKLDQEQVAAAMEAETGAVLKMIQEAHNLSAKDVRQRWGNLLGPKESDFTEPDEDEGPRQIFEGHQNDITSVTFSPDGRYVLSGSEDGTARLWNAETGNQVHVFAGHAGAVNSVSFSPDGASAVSGSNDGTMRLWNVATGNQIRVFNGPDNQINSVFFSPDPAYAVSISNLGIARVWDVARGSQIWSYERLGAGRRTTARSPDGRYAVSADEGDRLRLWEVDTESEIHVFETQAGLNNVVAFSPDGRYVLSGRDDAMVRLWDVTRILYDYRMNGGANRSDLREAAREVAILLAPEQVRQELSAGKTNLNDSVRRLARVEDPASLAALLSSQVDVLMDEIEARIKTEGGEDALQKMQAERDSALRLIGLLINGLKKQEDDKVAITFHLPGKEGVLEEVFNKHMPAGVRDRIVALLSGMEDVNVDALAREQVGPLARQKPRAAVGGSVVKNKNTILVIEDKAETLPRTDHLLFDSVDGGDAPFGAYTEIVDYVVRIASAVATGNVVQKADEINNASVRLLIAERLLGLDAELLKQLPDDIQARLGGAVRFENGRVSVNLTLLNIVTAHLAETAVGQSA